MTASLILLAAALVLAPGTLRTRARCADVRPMAAPRQATTDSGLLSVAFSLDVLAVCLRSGMTVAAAVSAVAPCAPPGLARLLRRAGEMLTLGASPSAAWTEVGTSKELGHEQCRALARLARRCAESGATMAGGIGELAVQCRRDAVDSAVAAAERAGVLIGAPLGLCFLPSFVCLGIVPVVMGLATDVFGAGMP